MNAPSTDTEAERDEDVFDSLWLLGPSTAAQLAEDTGRGLTSVCTSLRALRSARRAAPTGAMRATKGRWAKVWRAVERVCPHCGGALES